MAPPVDKREEQANRAAVVTSKPKFFRRVTMTDKDRSPSEQAAPERVLELKLKKNPKDKDAKVDVGSDESMDASDPVSATAPGRGSEPVPSSGFPEKTK
jgi:hypothetical protein